MRRGGKQVEWREAQGNVALLRRLSFCFLLTYAVFWPLLTDQLSSVGFSCAIGHCHRAANFLSSRRAFSSCCLAAAVEIFFPRFRRHCGFLAHQGNVILRFCLSFVNDTVLYFLVRHGNVGLWCCFQVRCHRARDRWTHVVHGRRSMRLASVSMDSLASQRQ